MSKTWKIVSTAAVIALLLGALCILAGIVTGGDVQRIEDILYAVYDLENKINALWAAMGISLLG